MNSYPRAFATLAAAVVLLAGCSAGEPVEVTQLTIATTATTLDQATSLAVAEYIEDEGTAVRIQQHEHHDAVFEALEAETGADHAMVAVVTAQQDPAAEESPLRLPADLDIVAQAPVELGLAPTTSTITAAQFSQAQVAQEPDSVEDVQDLSAACDELTWLHAETPDEAVEPMMESLAELGCEPVFESTDVVDAETHDKLTNRLMTEAQTVAMLYTLDPAIADQGLATLELETAAWPNSNVVALANTDLDETVAQQVTAVLEVLDSDGATDLLRGYHDAAHSESDVDYDIDDAMRYWLAGHDLLDDDMVTDTSPDNE